MALSLTASSLAFNGPMLSVRAAPAARTSVQMAYNWDSPSGIVYDPLGLLKKGDKFERLRYVEVKHGRIAMLAVLGHVAAAAGARIPGQLGNGVNFADIKGSGFAALSQVPFAGLLQIFLFIGFLEINVMKVTKGAPSEFPGDLRNGQFAESWDNFPQAKKDLKRNTELNNGRAAMMGILGLMVHEQLPGSTYVLNEAFGLPVPM